MLTRRNDNLFRVLRFHKDFSIEGIVYVIVCEMASYIRKKGCTSVFANVLEEKVPKF